MTWTCPHLVANTYDTLSCVFLTNDMKRYCASNNIPVMAYTSTLNAAYNKTVARDFPPEYDTPANAQKLKTLYAIADEVDASPLQVVLACLMAQEPPIIPLITGSTEAQIGENIGSLNVELSADQIDRLNAAGQAADPAQG